SLAALGHAPRGGECRRRPAGYFDLKKLSPGVTTAYWGRRWLLAGVAGGAGQAARALIFTRLWARTPCGPDSGALGAVDAGAGTPRASASRNSGRIRAIKRRLSREHFVRSK